MSVPKPKVTLQRVVLHCVDRWHIDELLIVLSIAWPPNYASLSFCSSKSFHSLVPGMFLSYSIPLSLGSNYLPKTTDLGFLQG